MNAMKTIKVIAMSNSWSGGIPCELDKKFFKDMVFQAMYYRDSYITVDNHTLSGTTLLVKRIGHPVMKKYAGDYKKVASLLWTKAKMSKRIVFSSSFEHVEYLIQK